MRRHAILFGSFVALLTSQAAMLDAQPATPTPLGRWAPPPGVSGPPAAIWGGLGLIGTVLSGGWPATPRAAGPPIRTIRTISSRNDGSSVEVIMAALYESVSHGPGSQPDWERMRGIFLPAGMIVPPRGQEDLFTSLNLNGFQDSVRRAMASMEQKGEPTALFEREVARRADCFANVCHVFSTYESRHTASDEKPFARGINSIQLVGDGKRWWIASVTWETERPDNPIPPDYLPATIPPEYLRKH